MRRAAMIGLSAVGLVLVHAGSARSKRPKPQRCLGGRYLVSGSALVTGDSAAPIEAVIIGPEISIGNACNPVHAKLKATSRGTRVLAVWPSCEGLKGKVKLKGVLDTTCTNLQGRLIAKKSKLNEPFVAQASRCGDGIVDAANGEDCDGAACAGGDPCSAECTCAPAPARPTTTSSSTSSTSSSTIASITTSSTATSSTTTSSTSSSTTLSSTTTSSTSLASTSTTSSTLETSTTTATTTSSIESTTESTSTSTTEIATTSTVVTTTATTSSTTSTTLGACVQGVTQRSFSVSFAVPDSSVIVQGLTLLIDYPEAQVTIPGSGAALTVRQSLSNVQSGALSSPFDLDTSLREQIAGTAAPLTPGMLFTIDFFDCVDAPPPTAADFNCTVQVASDPLGQPDTGVTCSVASP